MYVQGVHKDNVGMYWASLAPFMMAAVLNQQHSIVLFVIYRQVNPGGLLKFLECLKSTLITTCMSLRSTNDHLVRLWLRCDFSTLSEKLISHLSI